MSIACITVPFNCDSLLVFLSSNPLLTSQTCNGLPTEPTGLFTLVRCIRGMYISDVCHGGKNRPSLCLHPYFSLHLK